VPFPIARRAILAVKDKNMTLPLVSPRRETSTAAPGDQLRDLENTLQTQLDTLPTVSEDGVAAAHRANVEQNLQEVRLALRLHAEGRYGTCIRCADPIAGVRLEVRPWATRCIRCADRFGW
jgi:RNA polymerase-binding transcription factor DksA